MQNIETISRNKPAKSWWIESLKRLILLLKFGPIFTIALSRMRSRQKLDPVANWRFWTKRRSWIVEKILKSYPTQARRKYVIQNFLGQAHAVGIEFHYDVSNEFYKLFLDQQFRMYTCAMYTKANQTLEQAQDIKTRYLAKLLCPEPEHRILDLGCGWGGMMQFLAQQVGGSKNLLGLTLSQNQAEYVKSLGLPVQIADFIEYDYSPASWDRVISIGSIEHVRPEEIARFYRKIYEALSPGGRMVNQFFSLNKEPYPLSMLTAQLFFPGSTLVRHEVHIEAIKRAGFVIKADTEDCYKRTLKAWYDNLVNNQEQAARIAGRETLNEFLTFFPIAWKFFDDKEATLHRMLLVKE